VISNLDLVITTDTSVAHLAGALGVREWILLGNGSEWRWGEGASTTPFYPRARLFRRPAGAGWEELMGDVAAALEELLA
jgi:ADP-heptose:LPS heptosyltransferase